MDELRFAALVPMKGHSERVANKNLRDFHGKPLFWHVMHSLEQCPFVLGIYVDTDSLEIADAVKSFFPKAFIIERPEELRGDFVSMNEIIRHDIANILSDFFLQTHATNPLIKSGTILRACREYEAGIGTYDSLFSVNRLQARLYDKNGRPMNHDPSCLIRTQDLEPLFEENSNLYLFSRKSFGKTKARIGEKPRLFEMDPMEAVDIDEESDFAFAKALAGMHWKGDKNK